MHILLPANTCSNACEIEKRLEACRQDARREADDTADSKASFVFKASKLASRLDLCQEANEATGRAHLGPPACQAKV